MVEYYWLTLSHFALSLGFLALSGFALKDLLSGETTINVSKVYPEFIDTFPSFSVCTSTNFNFNANQLQNGVLNQIPFEVEITLTDLKLVGEGKPDTVNMMNKSQILDYFDGSWNVECKAYDHTEPMVCIPCIVYRIESLKLRGIERAMVDIKVNQTNESNGIVVAIHDSKQSLVLKQNFDWSQSFYFGFRPGHNLMIYHNLKRTEKKHISNCSKDEDFNPDKEMIELISKNISCSLPWSSFKAQGLDECKSEADFDMYLKALYDLQSDFKKIEKKCSFKSWKALPISETPKKGHTSIYYGMNLNNEDDICIENEITVYTFTYFIGIFGGYLGLFLGGSILGYLQMIAQFFKSRTA